ncbi:tRNA pseudouridine(13) synthase TruD [Planctomicrobium piriforme]|uniref:tRNA pseudouridine synthase D n=1 Tax=Planctomicrobium piriforme TaxID=1576369 RepID=A0A1I3B3K0_9PLAN|nr:tRNA pseudouridine(13) synthase TruD [Planctomicrobium piriforme]SFH56770.1 tRNA pseudouridine13 synthase [Planctomicrobium piriforme]
MTEASTPFVDETPCLTPLELSINGQLKVEPEDFVVEEVPAYLPSGVGEHLFLWIQKRDISAEFLTGHIARSLGVRRDDIGVAGLKDRRAVTRQWISVPATAEERIEAINTPAIQVLEAKRHGNKLKTGHLRGNRFELIVRGEPGQLAIAQQIAAAIAEQGVPNYFGDQRFGHDGETLTLGMSLLKGETDPRSIPSPKRKFLLRLALSAAQSSLFNTVLARRLQAGTLHSVQPGDVMQVCASGGLFVVEDVPSEQPRFDARETVITGPIFGPKMKSPLGDVLQLEQEILTATGLTREVFRTHSKLTPGTRRPLLLWPENLTVADHPHGLRLTFTLPSGCYATVVLREFLKENRD